MKSEAEIRAKLTYYQCLLAGFRAGANIDRASIFLALEQLFPKEALSSLRLRTDVEETIAELPLEDQGWVKEAFANHIRDLQGFLEDRVAILKWVLDQSDD